MDGLLEDVRQADAGDQRQDAEHGADDERIFCDLAEDVQRLRLLSAEHLQHDDGQHIEQRHNDRDQDRDGAELIGAEQRRRHGDAHDDVVAAEHALDQHAAALRQLFGQQRVAEREAERQQHAAHGIGHQQRVKRAGQIGAIYIIIKQTWQKNTESDLVDGGDLLTAEPAEAARAVAERHDQAHGQHGVCRDHQIFHMSPPFVRKSLR